MKINIIAVSLLPAGPKAYFSARIHEIGKTKPPHIVNWIFAADGTVIIKLEACRNFTGCW